MRKMIRGKGGIHFDRPKWPILRFLHNKCSFWIFWMKQLAASLVLELAAKSMTCWQTRVSVPSMTFSSINEAGENIAFMGDILESHLVDEYWILHTVLCGLFHGVSHCQPHGAWHCGAVCPTVHSSHLFNGSGYELVVVCMLGRTFLLGAIQRGSAMEKLSFIATSYHSDKALVVGLCETRSHPVFLPFWQKNSAASPWLHPSSARQSLHCYLNALSRKLFFDYVKNCWIPCCSCTERVLFLTYHRWSCFELSWTPDVYLSCVT